MKNRLRKIFFFLAAVLVMIGLNAMRSENAGDRIYHKIKINDKINETVVVDIGKMGTFKYYLEPEITTIYFRVDAKHEIKELTYTTENLDAIISQTSKKGIWEKINEEDKLIRNRNRYFPVNLELKIPYSSVHQYNVHEGSLKIKSGDAIVKNINLQVINSRYSE